MERKRLRRFSPLVALLAMGAGGRSPRSVPSPTPTPPDPAARPCADEREHRALDFWIGEWDVRPAAGPERPASRSRIERVEDGCVIYEQYTNPAGYTGRSFNAYDPQRKRWEQFWVDNKGGIHHYVGQARDGNLYYEAESVQIPGQPGPVRLKMTFFSQGPDQVRQLFEQSTDGGKTYSKLWDLIYSRRKPGAASAAGL